jgi:hypothetical protein
MKYIPYPNCKMKFGWALVCFWGWYYLGILEAVHQLECIEEITWLFTSMSIMYKALENERKSRKE